MKLEVGKIYWSRGGNKVKILETAVPNVKRVILVMNIRTGDLYFVDNRGYYADYEESLYDLVSEYSPWHDVKVDTPILVRSGEQYLWEKRHFAEFYNNKVYAFNHGKTSWSASADEVAYWEYAKLPQDDIIR